MQLGTVRTQCQYHAVRLPFEVAQDTPTRTKITALIRDESNESLREHQLLSRWDHVGASFWHLLLAVVYYYVEVM